MSQEAFGEEYKIGSQGMVWQYLHGKTPLNLNAAMKFAVGLGCPISAFSPTIANSLVAAGVVQGVGHAARTEQATFPFDPSQVVQRRIRSHGEISVARKSSSSPTRPEASPPTIRPQRKAPLDSGDPIARLEQCLNDLLILDVAKQQIMDLVKAKAEESAAMQRALLARMQFDRRTSDVGPPLGMPDQRIADSKES
jgi:hypothetical protein